MKDADFFVVQSEEVLAVKKTTRGRYRVQRILRGTTHVTQERRFAERFEVRANQLTRSAERAKQTIREIAESRTAERLLATVLE